MARREVLADISLSDRAEDRVGERMEPGIGVGMADQPSVLRNANAAEHHMVTLAEAVGVIAGAGAVFRRGFEQALGAGCVGAGDLHVGFVPLDHHDLDACGGGHRDIMLISATSACLCGTRGWPG